VIFTLEISLRSIKMADRQNHSLKPLPMANYSSAIARALEWLGDRYLLAKPVKAAPSRVAVAPMADFPQVKSSTRDAQP
jgi:hypothetical protein